MATKLNINIKQGSTFTQEVRWEAQPTIYKPITGISNSAPVSITATGHGIPQNWRVAVVSVKGMDEINSASPLRANDYHPATIVDLNTIQLNDVNSADYTPYISGGFLQFNTPVDMTGFTARMTIKDRIGGNVILALTTLNGMITIDNTNKVVTIKIPPASTTLFTFNTAVYDLEMVSATGDVTTLIYGAVGLYQEVTT